jgi:hypothetical protein
MPVHPHLRYCIGAIHIRGTILRYPNARFLGDKSFSNGPVRSLNPLSRKDEVVIDRCLASRVRVSKTRAKAVRHKLVAYHDIVAAGAAQPACAPRVDDLAIVLSEPRYRIPPFSRVIPGLGAMALGIARTAIETFIEIASVKTPERTTRMLRDNHGAQVRVSQAEALVRSARLFLFDSLEGLWRPLIATGEVTMEARAHVRLAASHAVASAVQAVDLPYSGAGASAFTQLVHWSEPITQHIGVHPRVLETTGRVLFGLEPDTPLL